MEIKQIPEKIKALAKKNPVLFWGGIGVAGVVGFFILNSGGESSAQENYLSPLENYGSGDIPASDLTDLLPSVEPDSGYDWGSSITGDNSNYSPGGYYDSFYTPVYSTNEIKPDLAASKNVAVDYYEDGTPVIPGVPKGALSVVGSSYKLASGEVLQNTDFGIVSSYNVPMYQASSQIDTQGRTIYTQVGGPGQFAYSDKGNVSWKNPGTTKPAEITSTTVQGKNILGGLKAAASSVVNPVPTTQRYQTPSAPTTRSTASSLASSPGSSKSTSSTGGLVSGRNASGNKI